MIKRFLIGVLSLMLTGCLSSSGLHPAPGSIFIGDSIVTGTGVANPTVNGFAAQAAPSFGGTYTNLGVGSQLSETMTRDTIFPNIKQDGITTPSIVILTSANDAADYGADLDRQNITLRAMEAGVVLAATPQVDLITGQSSSCAPQPGWAPDNEVVSGMGMTSSTSGSVLVCTVAISGNALYVNYRAWDGGQGSLGVKIDGAQPVIDSVLYAYGQNHSTIFAGDILNSTDTVFLARYPIAAGTHTIEFTVLSGRNTVMTLSGPFSVPSTMSPVYVGGTVYVEQDMNSGVTASYNAMIANFMSTLRSDGLPVRFVPIRKYLNATNDFDGGVVLPPAIPGVSNCTPSNALPYHMGNCGHDHLAQAFVYYHQFDLH